MLPVAAACTVGTKKHTQPSSGLALLTVLADGRRIASAWPKGVVGIASLRRRVHGLSFFRGSSRGSAKQVEVNR